MAASSRVDEELVASIPSCLHSLIFFLCFTFTFAKTDTLCNVV